MKRRTLTTRDRAEIFGAAEGRCHLCGGRIEAGQRWEAEHVIPLAMGGEDGLANLAPAHVRCHRTKTRTDASDIAKAKRREAKHLGFHRPRSGFSGWRKFNGEVVKR